MLLSRVDTHLDDDENKLRELLLLLLKFKCGCDVLLLMLFDLYVHQLMNCLKLLDN